jgi:hypothetical protein
MNYGTNKQVELGGWALREEVEQLKEEEAKAGAEAASKDSGR